MKGGEAIAVMLERHGVEVMFGMGGFQLLPMYEGLRNSRIRHVLVNDERAGTFMADAYARVSERPGVVDATLGPGATNLVTALVEARNAGVPIVGVVGDTNRAFSGRNMTQEGRQVDILRPAVKELIRVEEPSRLPEHVRRAFSVATSGRPGPVVIDVPEDVSHAEVAFEDADLWAVATPATYPLRRCRPDAADVAAAAAILETAERPVVLAGGGVHLSRATSQLASLARAQMAPVAYTMTGKGCIADDDPLCLGVFGRYDRIANEVIAAADVVLCVGCKLGEIATKRYTLPRPGTKVIQLDIDAEEIGRFVPVVVGLWGDAQLGLDDLAQALRSPSGKLASARSKQLEQIRSSKLAWQQHARARLTSNDRPINVGRLIGELSAALPPNGIVVADGGFAAHWSALLLDLRSPRRGYLADRGFASIGYGLPGCIGASLAGPPGPVVGITGDGGFNLSVGELETARRLGVAFTLVVVNNAASGYVKALQHAVYGAGAYQSSDLCEVDYAAVARAYGCAGERVEDPSRLAGAIKEALASPMPFLLDVAVTRDPAQMLPAADSRALTVRDGDRPI